MTSPGILTEFDVAEGRHVVMKKLPEINLAFWVMEIAATTLGETADDLFAQTLRLGYFLTTIGLFAVFVVTLVIQLRSRHDNPFSYWTVMPGYAGGALLVTALLGLLLALKYVPPVPNVLLFWLAFVLTRPLGATAGDFLTKPTAKGVSTWAPSARRRRCRPSSSDHGPRPDSRTQERPWVRAAGRELT